MGPCVGIQADYWLNHLFSLKNRIVDKMTVLGQVSSPVQHQSAMARCGAGHAEEHVAAQVVGAWGTVSLPSPGLSSTLLLSVLPICGLLVHGVHP